MQSSPEVCPYFLRFCHHDPPLESFILSSPNVQPNIGYGPRVHPDTPEAFLNHTAFHNAALRAATPPGYRFTFRDLYAAANAPRAYFQTSGCNNTPAASSTTPCYMGYHLLAAYDPPACASLCESDPSGACVAFNLYVERDPEWNPWRCSCDRPRGVTNYKCALFAGAEAVEDAGRATNFGQAINGNSFARKIVGSNGYVKIGAAGRKGGVCQARTPTGGGGSGSRTGSITAVDERPFWLGTQGPSTTRTEGLSASRSNFAIPSGSGTPVASIGSHFQYGVLECLVCLPVLAAWLIWVG